MLMISRCCSREARIGLALAGALVGVAACADGSASETGDQPVTRADGSTVVIGGDGGASGPVAGGAQGGSGARIDSGGMSSGSPGGSSTRLDAGSSTGSGAGSANPSGNPSGGGGEAGVSSADLSPLTAPLPAGKAYSDWTWVDVPGALCRDGSPAGYYYRRGTEAPLMIFMNGGGTCTDPFFCGLNPKNVNENLPTQSLIDATGNVLLGPDADRQMPTEEGVFKRDPKNPVGNWNMIYVPYCTGDVFAGSKNDGVVPGVEGTHQFVGYKNIGLFLESFGPSFGKAGKVLLTGSSAGGFGTLLNYDRTQIFFDKYNARVYGVTDSGIPFRDEYLAPCLQKLWRDLWNLDAALPKDCKGCFRADGGGLTEGLGDFLFHEKYKGRKLGGMISSAEDGVIRAFFGSGLDNCMTDPGLNTILSALNLGGYSGEQFRAGLKDAAQFVGNDAVSTYFLPSWEHMHLWRARYYDEVDGVSIASWLGDVLNEKVTHIGAL